MTIFAVNTGRHGKHKRLLFMKNKRNETKRTDDEIAVNVLEVAAEQGNAEAQVLLGLAYMYHQGDGVDVNYKKTLKWFEKAAEQGNAVAQALLGAMYSHFDTHFDGVDVNYKKAFEWYEKAAEQGHAQAQCYLGAMYDQGHGVDVNCKKAIEWYKKAAKQGDVEAQYNLGVMYHYGHDMEKNYKKAFEWYEKAAEQGYAQAQYFLGELYHHGLGVDQNDSMAIRLYHEASKKNQATDGSSCGSVELQERTREKARAGIKTILTARRHVSAAMSALNGNDQDGYVSDDEIILLQPKGTFATCTAIRAI